MCHWCSYNILASSVNYYWTDARQHGIYLFRTRLLQLNLFFRIFHHNPKAGLAHFGGYGKKSPFDVIRCLYKMKQSHLLLCVAKNCDWSLKNELLSILTRNSLLVEMKTYCESRIKLRNLQIINKMLQKRSFCHYSCLVSRQARMLLWMLQELRNTLGKLAVAVSTGGHSIRVSRRLKTVSSTLMGHKNHSIPADAKIMVSTNCPTSCC